MSRAHTAYVERHLLPFGLRVGQGSIVSALGERQPCSQKELAEYRHVSAATISVMLRRMEKSGLVARLPAEEGKCNQITLTEEGERLSALLRKDMIKEPDLIFAGLSEEEKESAGRIFQKLSDNLLRLAEK